MHDLSIKFQFSQCNIVIFMHVPRYALDVLYHAVDTLATAGQNSLSLWHTLLFSWDLPDLKSYCLLEFQELTITYNNKNFSNQEDHKRVESGKSYKRNNIVFSENDPSTRQYEDDMKTIKNDIKTYSCRRGLRRRYLRFCHR